ncbi:MAG: putative esterase [Myxococcota bacterium]|jgi:predicted esterase
MRYIAVLAFLAACVEPKPEVANVTPPPLPLAPSGTCPAIEGDGTYTFESNGREREVIVYLPNEIASDQPILFMWHGVGDTGTILPRVLGARAMSEDQNAIIVIPQSLDENPLEWGFLNGGEDDLALFDDMRSCLHRDFDVDLSRIYSTGFSGGGLWTTFLTMNRSDVLAAVLMFSGGTEPIIEYNRLEWDIPVLLSWGGSNDTWGQPGLFEVEFEVTTLDLQAELMEDEHLVVSCNHGLGHTLPASAGDMVSTWLFGHTFGVASPFLEGELTGLPDFCERK